MSVPAATKQWRVRPKTGLDGLTLEKNVSIPTLGDTDCLVKIEAASLNYRDVALTMGNYPMAIKDSVIPTSDGAGKVVAVGPKVKLFKIGDSVCTLFHQGHQSGPVTPAIRKTPLGTQVDGPLRYFAVYPETGLVPAPKTLSTAEAATLPCAAVTAWNALTGLSDRKVQPGEYVLVQGTGGVSLFAAQFALAMGAIVIGTTSSDSKAARLNDLGVQHVINYRDDPNCGETAKKLTADGDGVHHVIEVGGEATIAQSLKAVRFEGVISIIGFVGGKSAEQKSSFGDILITLAVVRGVNVGSKEQFVAMNQFIDEHRIKPVVDAEVFPFHEVKEAYQYLLDQKHFGKVVIDVTSSDSR